MTQVIIDRDTQAKLNGLNAPLLLCDERGQPLGQFLPFPVGTTAADLEPDIPSEELRRRAEHFQGRPLADLLAKWEKRK